MCGKRADPLISVPSTSASYMKDVYCTSYLCKHFSTSFVRGFSFRARPVLSRVRSESMTCDAVSCVAERSTSPSRRLQSPDMLLSLAVERLCRRLRLKPSTRSSNCLSIPARCQRLYSMVDILNSVTCASVVVLVAAL